MSCGAPQTCCNAPQVRGPPARPAAAPTEAPAAQLLRLALVVSPAVASATPANAGDALTGTYGAFKADSPRSQ